MIFLMINIGSIRRLAGRLVITTQKKMLGGIEISAVANSCRINTGIQVPEVVIIRVAILMATFLNASSRLLVPCKDFVFLCIDVNTIK